MRNTEKENVGIKRRAGEMIYSATLPDDTLSEYQKLRKIRDNIESIGTYISFNPFNEFDMAAYCTISNKIFNLFSYYGYHLTEEKLEETVELNSHMFCAFKGVAVSSIDAVQKTFINLAKKSKKFSKEDINLIEDIFQDIYTDLINKGE